jgi:hypothetical protein
MLTNFLNPVFKFKPFTIIIVIINISLYISLLISFGIEPNGELLEINQ